MKLDLTIDQRFMQRILTALLVLATASASAQDSTRSWGFTSARVDSYTAAFVYTGHGYRDVFAFGGVMYNQRTAYTELAGGVGAKVAFKGTHMFATALSKAADSRYVQFFYLPSARVLGLSVESTIEGYAPLDPGGEVQYYVTPLSAFANVAGRIGVGASYELAYQPGTEAVHWLGPELRFSLPRAVVVINAYGGVANAPGKVRFGFKSSY